jgi:uncharacterized membrane protein affecting hemolysin expression
MTDLKKHVDRHTNGLISGPKLTLAQLSVLVKVYLANAVLSGKRISAPTAPNLKLKQQTQHPNRIRINKLRIGLQMTFKIAFLIFFRH